MTKPVPQSVQTADRLRRLGDAARALPVLGLVLVLLPVLGAGRGGIGVWLYLFGLWIALILAAAVLARGLHRDAPADRGRDAP